MLLNGPLRCRVIFSSLHHFQSRMLFHTARIDKMNSHARCAGRINLICHQIISGLQFFCNKLSYFRFCKSIPYRPAVRRRVFLHDFACSIYSGLISTIDKIASRYFAGRIFSGMRLPLSWKLKICIRITRSPDPLHKSFVRHRPLIFQIIMIRIGQKRDIRIGCSSLQSSI